MRHWFIALGALIGVVLVGGYLFGRQQTVSAAKPTRLMVFAGAANVPPLTEAKQVFELAHPGVKVDLTFAGSGTLLSQMMMEHTGDVYVPSSDDFMDRAESKGVIRPGTRKIVCYLTPTISVQKGNPKQIRELADLARPGIKVGLAKAGGVVLGDVSDEILRKAGLESAVKKNTITYAADADQTQTLVEMGEVDAIIGWDVFQAWVPTKIENVPLAAELVQQRNILAAVTVYSKHAPLATEFVDFLASSKGRAIYARHGYSVTPVRTGPAPGEPR